MLAIGNGSYPGALGLIQGGGSSLGIEPPANSALWKWTVALSGVLGAAALAYHGYSRTRSTPAAIGWGILGAVFPVNLVAGGVAAAQGFGRPMKRSKR